MLVSFNHAVFFICIIIIVEDSTLLHKPFFLSVIRCFVFHNFGDRLKFKNYITFLPIPTAYFIAFLPRSFRRFLFAINLAKVIPTTN